MDEKEITKFDITEATLRSMVEETKGIVNVDIDNKEDIEKVKKARIAIGKIRIELQRFGKDKRDWFNLMSKKIITREKELIAIIEPEEDRLKAFEEEFKSKKELADRVALLPVRKEKLFAIDKMITVDDSFLCSMDSSEFMGYCNELIASKNEKSRLELEERENKLKVAETEAAHKEEVRIAAEKAREDEIEKADQREKNRIDNERILKEKEEKKDQEEKEALDKDKKYKKWLKDNGYTEETKNDFVLEKVNNKVRLSKIIGIYTL